METFSEFARRWWHEGPGKGSVYADPEVNGAWREALQEREQIVIRQALAGFKILQRLGFESPAVPYLRNPVNR